MDIMICKGNENNRKQRKNVSVGAVVRACVAYEQPTESTHCLTLGTRREEVQRATEGDIRKNCGRREPEDGFRHLE